MSNVNKFFKKVPLTTLMIGCFSLGLTGVAQVKTDDKKIGAPLFSMVRCAGEAEKTNGETGTVNLDLNVFTNFLALKGTSSAEDYRAAMSLNIQSAPDKEVTSLLIENRNIEQTQLPDQEIPSRLVGKATFIDGGMKLIIDIVSETNISALVEVTDNDKVQTTQLKCNFVL